MRSATTSGNGRKISASVWAGMADIVLSAHRASAAISPCASIAKSPASIARAEALAAIPDELPAEEAGPFMCAGVTVYNALRNSGARGGQVVAVHGIGGLGHLGVQYARQMGFKTVALGRGKDKEPLAKKLGAHRYIDSDADDAVAELQKLGGARVILATAPNAKAISTLVDGLSTDGKLLVPAAPNEPLAVSMMPLIAGRRLVAVWYSGTAKDSQDTLEFSVKTAWGVAPGL